MQEIIMTPEVCIRFLIWSYYYHDITPTPSMSYADCKMFSESDAKNLDELKDTLFRCFSEESVGNSLQNLAKAKMLNEPCPFPQSDLDATFAFTKK